MVTNSFGNRNFMQPMEGPSVHSRCLAFISFKFWEEGPGGGGFLFIFLWFPMYSPTCSMVKHLSSRMLSQNYFPEPNRHDRQTPWSKWGHKSTGCCCGPPAGPVGGCLPWPPCPAQALPNFCPHRQTPRLL